jgi:hypothetical protein
MHCPGIRQRGMNTSQWLRTFVLWLLVIGFLTLCVYLWMSEPF